MFALANMIYLFADELTGLGRWRFAGLLVGSSSFESFLFRHGAPPLFWPTVFF